MLFSGNAKHHGDCACEESAGSRTARDGCHHPQLAIGPEECESYVCKVEASLASAAEAAEKIHNDGCADIAVGYIMHFANLLKAAVPVGPALQIASAILAKERIM